MAWNKINVQDKAMVEAWKAKAQKLNERAAAAVKAAQEALKEFQQTATGLVFNKVVEYSGAVISGMTRILEGMNEILNAVTKLINDFMNWISGATSDTNTLKGKTVG